MTQVCESFYQIAPALMVCSRSQLSCGSLGPRTQPRPHCLEHRPSSNSRLDKAGAPLLEMPGVPGLGQELAEELVLLGSPALYSHGLLQASLLVHVLSLWGHGQPLVLPKPCLLLLQNRSQNIRPLPQLGFSEVLACSIPSMADCITGHRYLLALPPWASTNEIDWQWRAGVTLGGSGLAMVEDALRHGICQPSFPCGCDEQSPSPVNP